MKFPRAFAWVVLVTLVGCETPQPAPADPAPAATETMETEPTAPEGKSPVADAPAPPTPSLPPLAPGELKKLLVNVYNLLDAGEEDKAKVELERASLSNPKEEEVRCLLSGITVADPVAAYGKESRTHTVARGEGLGVIARNYTGKLCEFYAIARYNNIRVPKQLAIGQTIRIPSSMVVANPPPPPPTPVAKPAPAPVVVHPPPPPAPTPTPAPAPPPPEPKVDTASVERLYRSGIAAYQRHDLRGAIGIFNRVLSLSPNHGGASTYRQRALDECAKINKISPGSCAI